MNPVLSHGQPSPRDFPWSLPCQRDGTTHPLCESVAFLEKLAALTPRLEITPVLYLCDPVKPFVSPRDLGGTRTGRGLSVLGAPRLVPRRLVSVRRLIAAPRSSAAGEAGSAGRQASASTAAKVVGTWPVGAGRTAGETRRSLCRIRATARSDTVPFCAADATPAPRAWAPIPLPRHCAPSSGGRDGTWHSAGPGSAPATVPPRLPATALGEDSQHARPPAPPALLVAPSP